jgi:hypothetical protein
MNSEESKENKDKEPQEVKKPSRSINLSFSLSTTTRWILTALILGVGVVLVVVFYAQEQARNSKLKDDVATAETTMITNGLQRNALEAKLLQANLEFYDLQGTFPSSQQSVDIEEALYRAAAEAGVDIASISCSDVLSETVGSKDYGVFEVNVSVWGELEPALTFAGQMGYWLPSCTIQSASMSSIDEGISMSLNLKVYTAEPAANG